MLPRSLLIFCTAVATGTYATTITDDPTSVAGKTFDYVIAGGGLTGIVAGNKLSAKGYKVLIIEAGKNLPDNPAIYDVERRGELNNDPATDCNWHYTASLENGTDLATKVDSGKCVGGSTSINGVMWYRPDTVEMDAIKNLGNSGWGSSDLVPYYTAEEHNIPPDAAQRAAGADYNPSFHGTSGPVNTSFPTPMRIPAAQALYKQAYTQVLGVPLGKDLSDRSGPGGSVLASSSWSLWYDSVSKINRRSSAAYAYLYASNQQRDTLTVLHSHTVGKVNFASGVKANGLTFGPTGGGTLYNVTASKEVLLAAGSLASPPILERSGIGSKVILSQFGIMTLVDLPSVGLNLVDQPGTAVSGLVFDGAAANTSLIDNRNIFAPVIALANIDQVFGNESGVVQKDLQNNIKSRAKAAAAAKAVASYDSGVAIFGAAIDLMTTRKMAIAEFIGESYPSIMSSIFWPSTPLSRGHIHIASADPFAPPKIVPRFLSDAFDTKLAVNIAKKGRSLFQTQFFTPVVQNPAVDAVPLNATDAEWEAWYKQSAFGASHWLGSCAMLPKAKGGVVSDKLKVYGTKNLRVIDLSILPLQITAHTQSTAYVIAQKAADLILADA